ncbi:MAG: T9SS type A sorting domain-containing protein [Saprospiraceae bacterium]
MKRIILFSLAVLGGFAFWFFSSEKEQTVEQSGAGLSMDNWAFVRSYPSGKISTQKWTQAYDLQQLEMNFRDGNNADWEALGPENIGGRTISLAFHPTDPNIMYAGSAGGGLWKTTTAGVGAKAWDYVPTGFPVIGVGAIVIDENDPNVMYIGTGEVYNYTAARPGIVNRLTRGSYGIGILKTTDGGETWTKSLDWSLSELTGVQDMKIDPENSDIVYAATTLGLYRTSDAGETWENIHDKPMATDIEIRPDNSQILYVAHGGYLSPEGEQGVFLSTDGGVTFERVGTGLPTNYEGKTRLAISPSNPDMIYASVGDIFQSRGLYRSEDGGRSWTIRSTADVARYQGWYSHDVAVSPVDPELVINVGVDAHRSFQGGIGLEPVSDWSAWSFGRTIAGEPEGPDFYVHADIHAAYFSPHDENTVYLATDGGVFYSNDAGSSWAGRNGGYQTQQFYANFANSTTDANFAIGGMQDNSTAIFLGDGNWKRVLGGDGMSAAIDPRDDSRMYASYQNLNIVPSNNRGETFSFGERLRINSADQEARAFNGPFELAPSDPSIIYAGAQRLHLSINRGLTWSATTSTFLDRGNPIITLEVAPQDANLVYVATSPETESFAGVYKTINAGTSFSRMDGLPDRVAMDFAIDPVDENIVYVVYSGFDVQHLYKTEDGGATWSASSDGLPDVPTNTVKIDPFDTDIIYVGNDIGVYVSEDAGESWSPYMANLPDGMMAMDLSISLPERKLRVATHGHGVFQTDLVSNPAVDTENIPVATIDNLKLYPNPTADFLNIEYQLPNTSTIDIQLFNAAGQLVKQVATSEKLNGTQQQQVTVSDLASGIYYIQLQTEAGRVNRTFVKE